MWVLAPRADRLVFFTSCSCFRSTARSKGVSKPLLMIGFTYIWINIHRSISEVPNPGWMNTSRGLGSGCCPPSTRWAESDWDSGVLTAGSHRFTSRLGVWKRNSMWCKIGDVEMVRQQHSLPFPAGVVVWLWRFAKRTCERKSKIFAPNVLSYQPHVPENRVLDQDRTPGTGTVKACR